jgi:hypothetical protein
LAVAPVVACAADQCKVNDLVVQVWDGPSKYMGGATVALTAPAVKVITVVVKPPGATGSSGAIGVSTAAAGGAAPTSGFKPAPKPPRPVPKNDQEALFNAVITASSRTFSGCCALRPST